MTFCFVVPGDPVQQGSMNAFAHGTRIVMVHQKGADLTSYRTKVAQAALGCGIPVIDGPVHVGIQFYIKRPKSAPKHKRPLPHKRPDLDKFVRAVLDALTGVCYGDDGAVVQIVAAKHYADDGNPRTEITVTPVRPRLEEVAA